jgi:hypothetical protein
MVRDRVGVLGCGVLMRAAQPRTDGERRHRAARDTVRRLASSPDRQPARLVATVLVVVVGVGVDVMTGDNSKFVPAMTTCYA